ncbi:asparagine synthetase [Apophysomyces ossiformis]|uniref:asparagine synthase (glutamine-hydrolyzing) n=1 Tax=Apophysomyces ossiformis TaxID=679940 RepID=A0A8H7BMU5_9FUNG|nr:asparagine synthetase [Apophysomyces ossiformis]
MCGIFCVYNYQGDINDYRQHALDMSKKLRHRGPDWSGCFTVNNHLLAHERLAIVGVDSGFQPMINKEHQVVLAANGEIYNHKQLRKALKRAHTFRTQSDCEVILHMFAEMDTGLVHELDGMFSFVLLDVRQDRLIAARDPIGITTLYYGWNSQMPDSVYFASELKALKEDCDKILAFPPGHIYDSQTQATTRYFCPTWWQTKALPRTPVNYPLLREALEQAVHKRLMGEVPCGVLLSGGLDSSLIAAIAAREYKRKNRSVLHSFSIGLLEAPDLIAARQVADHIGTTHHEFTFTTQEALDALSDVVYHLETYDVTTIRASTPMYLLARKIKAMGVKMVLSGEGADEAFGGYLYFHAAPSDEAFHAETVRRVQLLHTADCLRANKSTMAWGLEVRVPFLDKRFLEIVMSIDPRDKRPQKHRMEKYILRKAFDTMPDPYLPENILWRQKEQFSDGVGYAWIDALKELSASKISDDQLAQAAERWSKDTPSTKEAYLYRILFEHHFPQNACTASVMRWVPREDWGCPEDPSGRAQKAHYHPNIHFSHPQ